MMPEDAMHLFQEQADAWMKLMHPTAMMQSPAEAQKTWEGFFRQQFEIWEQAGEYTRKQVEQVMGPVQRQMQDTLAASEEMQRVGQWFATQAMTTLEATRDYFTTLAGIEDQLASLHRMTAEQLERMQAGLPRFFRASEPGERA